MKNLSLSLEKSLLSRDEMRFVIGGSSPSLDGGGDGWCSDNCTIVGAECNKPAGGQGKCKSFICDSSPTKGCL
jgi:hypothetical protein